MACLNASLEGGLDAGVDLGQLVAHFVVGQDVLEDGLARGTAALLQGGDGGGDHDAVLGVSCWLCRLPRLGGLLGRGLGRSCDIGHGDE